MRRFHQKSRLGCKQCKVRRVKCDETRPSCARCSKAAHPCSFLTEAPLLPLPPPSPVGNRDSAEKAANPAVHQNAIPKILPELRQDSPSSSGCRLPVLEPASPAGCYSMLHLQLLRHLENGLYEDMKSMHGGVRGILELSIAVGFETPYLMDELLAYSAAHKSIHHPGMREFYLAEANRLQARALSLYNSAAREIYEETCLPMFLFSSYLSHHVLFGVQISAQGGLGPVLDGLIQSATIHRGLCAIAKQSWPLLPERIRDQLLQSCNRDGSVNACNESRGECDALLKRLGDTDLRPSSIATLREVVEALQTCLDTSGAGSFHSMLAAIQDWLIVLPADYIRLLDQRKPEALVVLAHFAVVLHRAAGNWFIGDLGRRLVHLITDHLGQFYAGWIQWPSQAVEQGA